ncbi:MAG: glycogen synthase [bacterium]|nr:glycogen synthase [bacterium]
MSYDVSDWKKDWRLMDDFFSADEILEISRRIKNLEIRNLAFCSFENRFAKSGGLGAVTAKFLPYMNKHINRVLLLTPFYPHIIDENLLSPCDIPPFNVVYAGKPVKVELLETTIPSSGEGENDVHEYYLKAAGFFIARNAINDPYGYFPENAKRNDDAILENAMFFSKAVPHAMKALGIRSDILFHLQEWQTALVALSAKEAMLDNTLTSCGTVQTIHNPFDSWISPHRLTKMTANKKIQHNATFLQNDGMSAYQIGLQLADAPVTTVSENFARELTSDLLQTGHFAPHLQEILKKDGVYGINNGLFIDFPPEFSGAEKYSIAEIKKIKLENRQQLVKVLASTDLEGHFGQLTYKSRSIARLPNKVPILVMSGRLDPLQKGFDIFLRALEQFKYDEVKVILTPMAVRESDLDYFHEAASKSCGNLIVFPFRMKKGYRELQTGSTFGIMPSIYEPFGAAIEYMVSGTVTIARKTGGLPDQIQHKENGLLFREEMESYTLENIIAFSESADIVQNRKQNPWARAMADKLYRVLRYAVDMYATNPNEYYGLMLDGFQKAGAFTWHQAAKKYMQIYEKVKSF